MPGSWEIRQQNQVLCAILHTEATTMAWSLGFRKLQIPGPVLPLCGMPYDHARNVACQNLLSSPYEWLMFLDSDVIPPPDAIYRLMAHRQPFISGIYARRSPPVSIPVMLRDGRWLTEYPPNSVIEVDLVGAGCLLIHRTFLERLPPQRPGKPWFDWRVDMKGHLPEHECMSEDFTLCIPDGYWVVGPHMKKIEDVQIGDMVVGHSGIPRKVLDRSNRMYSGEMSRITCNYMRAIESTPNHRFLVRACRPNGTVQRFTTKGFDGISRDLEMAVHTKKKMWLEAKDVRKGDWLYVPKIKFSSYNRIRSIDLLEVIDRTGLKTFPDGKVGYNRTRKNALRLDPEIKITPDFCRLLGYYIAEGCAGKTKHAAKFCFGKTELSTYVADAQQILLREFGARSYVQIGNGGAAIYASSKMLGLLFSNLCGDGAYNKHLPPFWDRLDKECLTHLIRGYWRGDGDFNGYRFGANTKSERLGKEIQAALLKLNILCGVRPGESEYGTGYLSTIPICLTERFADVVMGISNIQLPAHRGKSRRYMREHRDHFLVRVVGKHSFLWEGNVNNLKVDIDESYVVNGVVTHNCLHARKHGVKVLVDTSVVCRHVGFGESTPGVFKPMESVA